MTKLRRGMKFKTHIEHTLAGELITYTTVPKYKIVLTRCTKSKAFITKKDTLHLSILYSQEILH